METTTKHKKAKKAKGMAGSQAITGRFLLAGLDRSSRRIVPVVCEALQRQGDGVELPDLARIKVSLVAFGARASKPWMREFRRKKIGVRTRS